MYKLLIADDESIILNGIKNCIDWKSLEIEVVATAADGAQTLELIERFHPDLCLLDIQMPFVDGLTVTKRYLEKYPGGVVILITGYDDFAYAQSAVNSGVTGYVLKPVDEKELLNTVQKAVLLLENRRKANVLLNNNLDTLRTTFFRKWLSGSLSSTEIRDHLEFFDFHPAGEMAVLFVRFYRSSSCDFLADYTSKADMDLIERKILALMSGFEPYLIMRPDERTAVAVHAITETIHWIDLLPRLSGMLGEEGLQAEILHQELQSVEDFAPLYRNFDEETSRLNHLSPFVRLLKQYIDQNYRDAVISLKCFAKDHNITNSYLSRQFKQEMGQSFVDYLTFVRLNKSISLLKNPHIKISAVAEFVGYSSQHYYCEVFKRKMDMSPSEYRLKLLQEERRG